MYVEFYIYFSNNPSPHGVDECLSSLHRWLMDLRELGAPFSQFHFSALSEEQALKNALQDNVEDFIPYLHMNDESGTSSVGISLWAVGNNNLTVRVEGFVSTNGNSVCSLSIWNIKRSEIENSNKLFGTIVLSAFKHMPVRYITQRSFKVHEDNAAAKVHIGWSIYGDSRLLRPLPDFPSYYLSESILKISSTEEVFDPSNPEHLKKARALDQEINSNERFVKSTGFRLPPFRFDEEAR